jgi:hypothetical protein
MRDNVGGWDLCAWRVVLMADEVPRHVVNNAYDHSSELAYLITFPENYPLEQPVEKCSIRAKNGCFDIATGEILLSCPSARN